MSDDLRRILDGVRTGDVTVEDALHRLTRCGPGHTAPSADLGFANVDLEREQRCGFPEVVFCAGKTPTQSAAIASEIFARSARVLLTRATDTHAQAVLEAIPAAEYHALSGCIVVDPEPLPATGLVAIIAAGTSDAPVAEEATLTARIMGAEVSCRHDLGIAGLHRLLRQVEHLREARVVVAVAGMEGALPSVVGGLIDRPVVAVPTSIGYGLSLDGIAPLLTMLNSCAAGVGVVNVDNGFGAGYLAALINRVSDPIDP